MGVGLGTRWTGVGGTTRGGLAMGDSRFCRKDVDRGVGFFGAADTEAAGFETGDGVGTAVFKDVVGAVRAIKGAEADAGLRGFSATICIG